MLHSLSHYLLFRSKLRGIKPSEIKDEEGNTPLDRASPPYKEEVAKYISDALQEKRTQ
jgi:hypothetical protein